MKINPYNRLLGRIKDWCRKVTYCEKVPMWSYPKKNLKGNWDLTDLYERIKAADQLEYDVILKATDNGIDVFYIKKMPEIPWDWK